MYILILSVLEIVAIIELLTRKQKKILYFLVFIMLTFLLAFRFGQGTDYFDYLINYNYTSQNINKAVFESNIHGEYGWRFICSLSRKIGLSFTQFISIISFIMMAFTYKCIKDNSRYKFMSLLFLFPTYFLTYYFSAIREGLVISIFLGCGLPLLVDEKYKKWRWFYFVLIIILSSIHSCALLLVLLPIITKLLNKKNMKLISIFLIIIFSLFGYMGLLQRLLLNISTSIGFAKDYLIRDISLNAILIRVIYFLLMYYLNKRNRSKNNELEHDLYNLYLIGFLIFIALSYTSTLSNRLTAPLKAIEIILFPLEYYLLIGEERTQEKNTEGLKRNKKVLSKQTLFIVLLFIVSIIPAFETCKNINAYIDQGDYINTNLLNYPYVSIWNKKDIYKYRNRKYLNY